MEELKKVEVTWLDSWGDTAHLALDEIIDFHPFLRRNLGLLIKGDDEKIIITSGTINNTFADKIFVDGIEIIPRQMIKEIKVLND